MPALSVLDLSRPCEGSDASQALNNSRALAQHCEEAGYHRYWVAEHHNMRGIASAATSVVISHIAGGTQSIRVGSGGHHAAQSFASDGGGTVRHTGGAVSGTDRFRPWPRTGYRRHHRPCAAPHSEQRPQSVSARRSGIEGLFEQHLAPATKGDRRTGLQLASANVYFTGSRLFGAQLAAILGLPFAFASHFAPDAMMRAINLYRQNLNRRSNWLSPM